MSLRTARTAIAIATAAGALAVLPSSSGAAAVRHDQLRHGARSCAAQWTNQHGYAYLFRLSVSGTSCATGTSLAAHHGHLRGWRCRTRRLATSAVQYMDRETCSSGRRGVSWEFSQNR